MRPRRTHHSNAVFSLQGGNEDNDLWLTRDRAAGGAPILRSTWQFTDAERERIAAGENVELVIWGTEHPPVSMLVVSYTLGAPAPAGDEAAR